MRKNYRIKCFRPFSDASDENGAHGKTNKRKFEFRFNLEKIEKKNIPHISTFVNMFYN